MCGILGITGPHQEYVEEALASIEHRGPDAQEVFVNDTITLGHARLAVIDVDARANQPFFSHDRTVGIVFNGEIYNYKTLRAKLEKLGHVFTTNSDTEVLVYAYKAWGKDMLPKLQGMFAFTVYDQVRNELFLAVDHAGIKPLYYWSIEREVVFSSELKGVISLLKKRAVPGVLRKESLLLYNALGYVPAPHTLYEDIYKMEPQSYVLFNLNTGAREQGIYEIPSSPIETNEELQKSIEESVEAHLVADVPVGLFFSGGTDSSLIAAQLHTKGISLKAYCVALPERPDDAAYAKAIGKTLTMPVATHNFSKEIFEEIFEEVLSKIDDPVADSSLFPTYFISREARKEVTVVLSGEGGDEYFQGYPRSRDLYTLRNAPIDEHVSLVEKAYFYLPHFRGKNKFFERIFVWMRRPVAFYLLTMSPTKNRMGLPAWRSAKREFARKNISPLYFDAVWYLPNVLLRKTDMATMFASLEGRVPLLDVQVVAAATHMQKKNPSPILKPVLKELLSRFLPRAEVYRKKTGFGLRTAPLFKSSSLLQREYRDACRYLKEHQLLEGEIPDTDSMLRSYPNMCWQIIMLYRACKNLAYGV